MNLSDELRIERPGAAQLLGQTLPRDAQTSRGVVRVVCRELNGLGIHDEDLVDAVAGGRHVLFIGVWRDAVLVGPTWSPQGTGCPLCLLTRIADASTGTAGAPGSSTPAHGPGTSGDTFGPAALGIAKSLVEDRLKRTRGSDLTVLVVQDQGRTVTSHQLLPDSTCRLCAPTLPSEVPPLIPSDVRLTKLSARTLRTRTLDSARLRQDYMHPTLGLFTEMKQDLQSPFGACSVDLRSRSGRREPGIGRAMSYDASQAVAILEGLERYAGFHRGGRAAVTRASYGDVEERAVDPRSMGTHPEESYNIPGFPHRPFDPDTVVDWTPAISLLDGRERLIPERAAFWGPRHDGEPSFFYDTSNGCSLGSSTEEAVIHGLREVAERDAYLMTWYRGLRLPEVDWKGRDTELDSLVSRSRLFTGFDVRVFLATMEYGIPSFLIVAQRPDSSHERPVTFMGAGAHPDPIQAIVGGLYELIGTIMATSYAFESSRPEALKMLREPWLMRRMEHHSMVGALPEARERFDFLLAHPPAMVALENVPCTRSPEPDLRADLRIMLQGMRSAGLDVLVVDQTMPELQRAQAHCVRVLVPGLLPMTFGHWNRRTEGLPRLHSPAPYAHSVSGSAVGATPHPFP
ncbi:TOMM precursor leader peptide-binding protein [Kocuria sp. CPCC 205297]|uniref:TOMM precursor leader peptide-binding protein n=1 Tax=Kocuria sp. CPCC 205297 TaxID=3073558 RepID=UPI0034D50DF3